MSRIELTEDQIFARYAAGDFWRSQNDQVFELSGAAGTGKTTCIRYILEDNNIPLDKVLFVAFTGKAATQLARQGLRASTTCAAFYDYEREPCRDEDGKIVVLPSGKIKTKFVRRKKDHLDKKYIAIVIDEATMINESDGDDILSFGLPVFAMGDLNQLPPVFGNGKFMHHPNVVLRQIMRQSEDDPIVWISQKIINGETLRTGVFKKSYIIKREDIAAEHFKSADMVITCTNKLRFAVNKMFREDFYKYSFEGMPRIGEKILCKKNNWGRRVGDYIYLTNGLTGTIDYTEQESFTGKKLKIDFKPDFTKKVFRNLTIDYNRLMSNAPVDNEQSFFDRMEDQFEFGYAITTHASQGSQWDYTLSLAETMSNDLDYIKKLLYTQVTRARVSAGLCLEKDRMYLS